jgi:hypothetical protein|tara:strand:+ start:333 stop:449 length:117 start_codon:yes stop_codon:yes gene_type:complete
MKIRLIVQIDEKKVEQNASIGKLHIIKYTSVIYENPYI